MKVMISIGGKRIRPRPCLTAYAALGGESLSDDILSRRRGYEVTDLETGQQLGQWSEVYGIQKTDDEFKNKS